MVVHAQVPKELGLQFTPVAVSIVDAATSMYSIDPTQPPLMCERERERSHT